MLEIKENHNTVVIFVGSPGSEAMSQIWQMCERGFHAASAWSADRDADLESGKVCPGMEGTDIGCGMLCLEIPKQLRISAADCEALSDLNDFICGAIPTGDDTYEDCVIDGLYDGMEFSKRFRTLRCYDHIFNVVGILNSIGTLGEDSYFIALAASDDGSEYLIVHSGSGELGRQVSEHYQNIGYRSALDRYEKTYQDAQRKLVEKLRDEGREKEIQSSLERFRSQIRAELSEDSSDSGHSPYVPVREQCAIEGRNAEDYRHDADICKEYARISRKYIAYPILDFLTKRYLVNDGWDSHAMDSLCIYIDEVSSGRVSWGFDASSLAVHSPGFDALCSRSGNQGSHRKEA